VIVLCTRTNNIWYPRLIAWMVFADVAEISALLVSLGSARCLSLLMTDEAGGG
jgi:hypothetical protein